MTEQKPWRPGLPVDGWIDVHTHFQPPGQANLDTIRDALREGCWEIDEFPAWDAGKTLAYMDRTGIQMQMLSYLPTGSTEEARRANRHGASLVEEHPDRFGLLAALPTDDPEACLAEIAAIPDEFEADGFATVADYQGVLLSDPSLEPVWAELDKRRAVVFAHPNAVPAYMGRPSALFEVVFRTAAVFVDMLYTGVFRRYPNVTFIVAHCGGGLPVISSRLLTLGNERWVPNPEKVTPSEMRQHLRRLFLDTAATAPAGMGAAMQMTTPDKLLYGSDCGPPCTSDATADRNLEAVLAYDGLTPEEIEAIGHNAKRIFPAAAARIAAGRQAG
jgi:predicted TIM-barrel fold metal-dependent hydrolase